MDLKLALTTESNTDTNTIEWQSPFEIRNNCGHPPKWEDANKNIYNIDRFTLVGRKFFWGKFAEKTGGKNQVNRDWVQIFFLMSPESQSALNPYLICSTFIKGKSVSSLEDAWVQARAKNIKAEDMIFTVDFAQTRSKSLDMDYNYVKFNAQTRTEQEKEQLNIIKEWVMSEDYKLITKIPQVRFIGEQPPMMIEYNGIDHDIAEDLLNKIIEGELKLNKITEEELEQYEQKVIKAA